MNNKYTEYQQTFTFVGILYSVNEEELISSDSQHTGEKAEHKTDLQEVRVSHKKTRGRHF